MSLSAGARLGPYEILTAVGAGGMGEVYKARDTRLDRTVAIKVLPETVAADPERRRRFEQEARAASALNHPHICVLYDVGSQPVTSGAGAGQSGAGPSVDYLVMEYLEGQTLARRLAKGRLPVDDAMTIGVQVADALAAAHRHLIVHRDLKPANVMLVKGEAGSALHAKLLDFGLARLAEPKARGAEAATQSASGGVVGTAPYMAPEQVEGRPADARTDLFAFGLVSDVMQATNAPSTPQDVGAAQVAVSATGTLAYVPGGEVPDIQRRLVWVDRRGQVDYLSVRSGPYASPRVSPDGRLIGVSTLQGDRRAWTAANEPSTLPAGYRFEISARTSRPVCSAAAVSYSEPLSTRRPMRA